MTDDPGGPARSRPDTAQSVPPVAVRPLDVDQAVRLDLPHSVVVLVGGAWRHAWLLGHDRHAHAVSFLVQRLDSDAGEAAWLTDVELGEVDPGYGAATA